MSVERALRLAEIPGVSLPEAAERAGVSLGALKRARKAGRPALTRDDLVLAALTRNGTLQEGPVGDLADLASWLDYVNHDGTTAAGLAQDLERLAAAGRLSLAGDHFRLAAPWP